MSLVWPRYLKKAKERLRASEQQRENEKLKLDPRCAVTLRNLILSNYVTLWFISHLHWAAVADWSGQWRSGINLWKRTQLNQVKPGLNMCSIKHHDIPGFVWKELSLVWLANRELDLAASKAWKNNLTSRFFFLVGIKVERFSQNGILVVFFPSKSSGKVNLNNLNN